jgi:high affinity Mn2+ porin
MTSFHVFDSSPSAELRDRDIGGAYAHVRDADPMKRRNRSRCCVLAALSLSILAIDNSARAADINMPVTASQVQTAVDWTGLYIGAHAGYSRGHSEAVLADPIASTTANSFSGIIGGIQAGYNIRLPSGLLCQSAFKFDPRIASPEDVTFA